MARKPRIHFPGALYHVISRGNRRQGIFLDEKDLQRFLAYLTDCKKRFPFRLYAYALLKNHLHLLVEVEETPLSRIMQTLLFAYASYFNRRHGEVGHLFQGRHKAILCDKDAYLLELVRYIHLNAIRAGLVADMKSLDRYPYSGHSRLTGKFEGGFQDIQTVLSMFAKTQREAKRRYKAFVSKGVLAGKRPELTGGGLLRSSGGWHALKQVRRLSVHFKSDERVLGDSDFVDTVLKAAGEKMDRKYRLQAEGYDFEDVLSRVCELFRLTRREVLSWSKQRNRAMARSVLAYWSVKELGMTAFAVAERLGLSPSAASRCVQRGERIVAGDELVL